MAICSIDGGDEEGSGRLNRGECCTARSAVVEYMPAVCVVANCFLCPGDEANSDLRTLDMSRDEVLVDVVVLLWGFESANRDEEPEEWEFRL